ncbi:hypothetical protein FOA43_000681 [Brettanomyces nanus]|uniref:Uncharacterized protein n=1 Tax=Eeniella nana TaxID=13502 RepID=A0A875RW49_EENNA|nr:uncharacterized protein FOA43_000681 [Brettanomyces nanus]QPG73371.1 hypothetical protein FOA43_000681 [Brettanomyces nanus]
MNIVHSQFLSYFTSKAPVQFNRPPKCYFYTDISLIVAIVNLVYIFTRFNNDGKQFHFELLTKGSDLSSLALRLLRLSKFKNKRSQEALIALLVIRTGLFVYDNTVGDNAEVNSYPMFQQCIDIAYQIGIHSDPNFTTTIMFKDTPLLKSRTLSPSQTRELWNYMQMIDANVSFDSGSPLLINYDYCIGYLRQSDTAFERKKEGAVILMRQLSKTINSRKDVCLRDILQLIDKVTLFCFSTQLSSPTGDDMDELAYLFSMKLWFLQSLLSLCRMVIYGIMKLPQSESLNELSKEMYRQSVIAAVTSLFIIKDILLGKSIFGNDPNGKYVVFFRYLFSKSLGQSFVFWFSLLLHKTAVNTDLIGDVDKGSPLFDYPPDEISGDIILTTNLLEQALYHNYNNETTELAEKVCSKLISNETMNEFSSSLYDIVYQNDVLKSSLDSFMMLNLVIVWLSIIRTLEEFKSKLATKKATMKDVIAQTKQRVEHEFKTRSPFDTDGYQLEKLFDSILADHTWLPIDDNSDWQM